MTLKSAAQTAYTALATGGRARKADLINLWDLPRLDAVNESQIVEDLTNKVLAFTNNDVGLDRTVNIARTASGTDSVGRNLSLWNVTADDAVITGLNFLNAHTFQHTWGGGRGGRQTLFSLSTQTSPTSADNENRNYVSAHASLETSSGDGGISLAYVTFTGTLTSGSDVVAVTDTTGLVVDQLVSGVGIPAGTRIESVALNTSITLTKDVTADGAQSLVARGSRGAYFAQSMFLALKSGATNVFNATGAEVNVAIESGASAYYKAGFSIIGHISDAVAGVATDAILRMSNQGTQTYRSGITFNADGGYFPVGTDGALLDTSAATVTDGFDLSNLTVTGALLKGPTALVRDTGGIAIFGGTSTVVMQSNGQNMLAIFGNPAGDNQWVLNGQGAGAPSFMTNSGSQTDIDFIFRAQGAGTLDVDFPTSGSAGAASDFIEIKVNGVARKIQTFAVS